MNILDKILRRLAALEAAADERATEKNEYANAKMLPLAKIGELYGVTRQTVSNMLHVMRLSGFEVEVSRLGRSAPWLVNVGQFGRAYNALKNTNFFKHEHLI